MDSIPYIQWTVHPCNINKESIIVMFSRIAFRTKKKNSWWQHSCFREPQIEKEPRSKIGCQPCLSGTWTCTCNVPAPDRYPHNRQNIPARGKYIKASHNRFGVWYGSRTVCISQINIVLYEQKEWRYVYIPYYTTNGFALDSDTSGSSCTRYILVQYAHSTYHVDDDGDDKKVLYCVIDKQMYKRN